MAEFYLDVSAVGNQYQPYADTPATWGVPQDGNGLAATGGAVAVATIDCAGASASGTGTVGVLGVTVSSTLNASGAALATAIVTAINASATATTATYSAALLPLNRLVFARVNPGVSTEVQIMLRIAGTDWNGMTPTRANITGGGVTAFTGGADGPSAYLCSTSTNLFGKTARGYGLLTQLKVASALDPGAAADVIHVRTRRGGADLQVLMTETATRYDWTWAPAASNRQFLFDDGTVWAGDAGQFTLNLFSTVAISGGHNSIRFPAGIVVSMSSRSGERARILMDVRAGSFAYIARFVNGSEGLHLDGVVVEESALAVAGLQLQAFESSNSKWFMRGGRWIAKGARQLGGAGANPGCRVSYEDVEFEYFGLTGNVSGIINLAGGGASDQQFRFAGCAFKDRNGVYSITSPVAGGASFPNAAVIVEFDGCTGVDAVASGWAGTVQDYGRQLVWENFGPSRDWRVESGVWLAEWRAGQNFPTLNSLLPGGQPWSAKVMLRNVSVWGVPQKVLKLPGYYRDTTATKAVTLEFLAQQAFSRSQLGLLLAYIDNNDVVRYQSTMLSQGQHLATPVSCDTSAAAWTLNGQTGYTAYKLALTTAFPIKQGTEFVAWVLFTGPLAADQTIYFDAEVGLT